MGTLTGNTDKNDKTREKNVGTKRKKQHKKK